MKVIGISKITSFTSKHADARAALSAWIEEAKSVIWETTVDIKTRYPSASFLSDNVVVFNIKGNSYRLVVKVSFESSIVLVQRVGTHAEYSKWKL